ncbi:MAG: hypothetical protein MJ252_12810 [archaeon]|nr:hypothetical protein [archaeon]
MSVQSVQRPQDVLRKPYIKVNPALNEMDLRYFVYRQSSFKKYLSDNMFKSMYNDNKNKYFKTLQLFIDNKLEKPETVLPLVQGNRPKEINYKSINDGKNIYRQMIMPSNQQVKKFMSKGLLNSQKIKPKPIEVNTANQKKEQNNSVNPNQPKKKTFIVLGGYRDIISNLINRGWVKCQNPTSTDFDYIWTLKTVDINYNTLKVRYYLIYFNLSYFI